MVAYSATVNMFTLEQLVVVAVTAGDWDSAHRGHFQQFMDLNVISKCNERGLLLDNMKSQ